MLFITIGSMLTKYIKSIILINLCHILPICVSIVQLAKLERLHDTNLSSLLQGTHIIKYEIPFEKFIQAAKPLLINNSSRSHRSASPKFDEASLSNAIPITNDNPDGPVKVGDQVGLLDLLRAVIGLEGEESDSMDNKTSTQEPLSRGKGHVIYDEKLVEKKYKKTFGLTKKDGDNLKTSGVLNQDNMSKNDTSSIESCNSPLPGISCGKVASCPQYCHCTFLATDDNGVCCPNAPKNLERGDGLEKKDLTTWKSLMNDSKKRQRSLQKNGRLIRKNIKDNSALDIYNYIPNNYHDEDESSDKKDFKLLALVGQDGKDVIKSKNGQCPVTQTADVVKCLTIGNLCHYDTECGHSNTFKCCPTPCGLRCLSPISQIKPVVGGAVFRQNQRRKMAASFSRIKDAKVKVANIRGL